MPNQKHILRENARKHIAMTDVLSEDIDAATDHFFNALPLSPSNIIAGYWPKGREFDATGILERALEKGYECALPCVEDNSKILTFKKWNKETALKKGAFGILEPDTQDIVTPDIILVPLLAFDLKGYRLGQGGGYYDATLSHARNAGDVTAIGVGYAAQAVLFKLPREDHDQKMDYILTPKELRKI
jgi:5-formyltetrahydrofolate cyclo-ligase